MEEMTKALAGKLGEDYCAKYYENHGYSIIARNYHSRYGEIDVIAENDTCIAFIEVKTREENVIIPAREAVIKSKQKKLMLTALKFISENKADKSMRFDIFEVLHNGEKLTKCRLNESAFDFDESLLTDVFF